MKLHALLLIVLFQSINSAWASQAKIKYELIESIKILLNANQELYPYQMEEISVTTGLNIKLISIAYAQTEFQCLYGGWPSTTIKVEGKTYCKNAKQSSYYQHSYACQKNQLTCPSVLFGKDVCVSYSTKQERLNAYNNCEKNQKTLIFDDDFPGADHQMIMEYLKIANDICDPQNKNPNVKKINCDKIQEKMQLYENTLKQHRKEAIQKVSNTKQAPKDCENCNLKMQEPLLSSPMRELSSLSEHTLYETLKDQYQSGPLCDPTNNFPKEETKEHALVGITSLLEACSFFGKDVSVAKQDCNKTVNDLSSFMQLSANEIKTWNSFKQAHYDGDTLALARLQLSIKKKALDANDSIHRELAKIAYLKKNILVNKNNKIECPFPSFEVFDKAMQGYNKLKKRLGKQTLTIVDYSMPSSHRRMFVIDIENNKIIHNTWVAHGSGNSWPVSQADGSNPRMSNQSGSNQSSDGFIIATQKAHGQMFGSNILLQGIDKNNKNIASRAIVLHGDKEVGGSYKVMNVNRDDTNERMEKLKSIDVMTTNHYDLRFAANAPGNSPTLIGETWGCLGVPDYPAYDIKTRSYKSQLELLQRDLTPKTLIFSYSGEEMQSDYF
jgi:hypothetical protein